MDTEVTFRAKVMRNYVFYSPMINNTVGDSADSANNVTVGQMVADADGIAAPQIQAPRAAPPGYKPPAPNSNLNLWIRSGLIAGAIIGAGFAIYFALPIVLPALAASHLAGVSIIWIPALIAEPFVALGFVSGAMGAGYGATFGMGVGALAWHIKNSLSGLNGE